MNNSKNSIKYVEKINYILKSSDYDDFMNGGESYCRVLSYIIFSLVNFKKSLLNYTPQKEDKLFFNKDNLNSFLFFNYSMSCNIFTLVTFLCMIQNDVDQGRNMDFFFESMREILSEYYHYEIIDRILPLISSFAILHPSLKDNFMKDAVEKYYKNIKDLDVTGNGTSKKYKMKNEFDGVFKFSDYLSLIADELFSEKGTFYKKAKFYSQWINHNNTIFSYVPSNYMHDNKDELNIIRDSLKNAYHYTLYSTLTTEEIREPNFVMYYNEFPSNLKNLFYSYKIVEEYNLIFSEETLNASPTNSIIQRIKMENNQQNLFQLLYSYWDYNSEALKKFADWNNSSESPISVFNPLSEKSSYEAFALRIHELYFMSMTTYLPEYIEKTRIISWVKEMMINECSEAIYDFVVNQREACKRKRDKESAKSTRKFND